jgi:DNA-binding CsgD family transcriptional regulator
MTRPDTPATTCDVTGGPVARADLARRLRHYLPALTRREAETALLLAAGYSNNEVAALLGISPHTARHHTENVMTKLWVRSRRAVRACVHATHTLAPAVDAGVN